jgi:hypothetical protein
MVLAGQRHCPGTLEMFTEKRKVGSSTLPLTTNTLSPAETLILGSSEPGSPAGTEENYDRSGTAFPAA